MKENGYFARAGVGAVAVLLMLFPTLIAHHSASDSGLDEQSASFKTHVRTQPVSNRRVSLQMVFDDGQVASATQLEGGLIRVESTIDNVVFGLTPLIADDGQVHVKVYRVNSIKHQGKSLGESLSEIETLVLNGDQARISNSAFNFSIRLADSDTSGATEKKTL